MMKYTDEMIEFFREYVPGHHYVEIKQAFNEKFPDTPIEISQVKGSIHRWHLNTGFTGRKEKGCPPVNKGKKQCEFMSQEAIERTKATRFKKGNIPKNHRPVGSERLSKDGYIEVKVAEPRKWKLRARAVWEEANGPIPKGHVIIHVNGIPTDDRLENLKLISRAVLVRVNSNKSFGKDKDINEAVINLAKLKVSIGEASKRK